MTLQSLMGEIVSAQERLGAEAAFPIRAVIKDGQEGFAIHALNEHSRDWQPVGFFQLSYADAVRERETLLDLLEEESAQLGRPAAARPERSRDADFARIVRGTQL